MGVKWSVVEPNDNNSRIPGTDSGDPENETGSLETERRVHRIYDTLETGLHMILSLVAPTRGAPDSLVT